jgi:pectinesterase
MPSNPPPAGVNPIHPFAGFERSTVSVPFRQYYHECMIQGDVDFIFGSATAVFDRCAIVSNKYGSEEFGYLTAASTFPGEPFGYVFRHCTITGDASPGSVFLGRPWRVSARTLFLHCTLGAHIAPQGWHDWGKPEAHQHTFFGEYNNSGPGSIPEMRPSWVKILSEEDAVSCSTERILGRHDHWDPGTMVKMFCRGGFQTRPCKQNVTP